MVSDRIRRRLITAPALSRPITQQSDFAQVDPEDRFANPFRDPSIASLLDAWMSAAKRLILGQGLA
jgi:hypothetical protein